MRAGDRGDDSPLSPRQVLLAHYVAPPCVPEPLDVFVESMLSTRIGDDFYPGTARAVQAWPGTAPGDRGVLNTLAPTHLRLDALSTVDPKPLERSGHGPHLDRPETFRAALLEHLSDGTA